MALGSQFFSRFKTRKVESALYTAMNFLVFFYNAELVYSQLSKFCNRLLFGNNDSVMSSMYSVHMLTPSVKLFFEL
jgi:hypothetical protein